MKKHRSYITAGLLALLMLTQGTVQAKDKLAQSGFQFLSVISDGQGAALAGAMTARELGSNALFFNPAGMARIDSHFDATFSLNEWIADIKHQTASLAFRPALGQYGVFGFSAQFVDYGDVQGTVFSDNDDGFLDTEIIKPTAMSVGVGYAKAITDRFAIGGQVRYLEQDLGESIIPVVKTLTDTIPGETTNKLNPLAFDFGTIYQTGLKGMSFGMSIRNFAKEIKYAKEGFEIPLTFTMGIAIDLMNLLPETDLEQSAMLSVDASHYRAHAEQIKVGLDYTLFKMVSARVGYISSSGEEDISYGFGISKMGLCVDYSYTPYGLFGDITRMTVRFSI